MTSSRVDVVRDATAWAPPGDLVRLQRPALLLGSACAALGVAGAGLDPAQFFRSYLVAFLLCLGVPLGCLGLALLHNLTGGSWGIVIRRVPEAAARTLVLVALFFVPLLFGLRHLFEWARPEAVAQDPVLQHKSAYLNVQFFVVRMALYFALWSGMAWLLSRGSRLQDEHWDGHREVQLRALGAVGLVIYVITVTFLAFDLLMSLDARWFSTIYGFYLLGGQVAAALSFVILVGWWLQSRPPMSGVLSPRHFNDYGKLLLAFLALWVYFAYSQYIIIWSGNIHEEIGWYIHRRHGGWRIVSPMLFLLHFAVPFVMLLSKQLRRDARRLALVAALVLVMRWVDLWFQASPSWHPDGVELHWLDFVLPIALAGLWFAYFVRQLRGRPILPFGEPHLEEALGDSH